MWLLRERLYVIFEKNNLQTAQEWNKSYIVLMASYVHPKTGNHLRSNLTAIMALDHRRLIRPRRKIWPNFLRSTNLLWPSQCNASFPIARPTHFFGKVKKKKKFQNHSQRSKYFNLQAHDLVLLTPIVLNYHRCFLWSLFRHLIVLLIYIFYHLIISCRLNVRFNMQSCVHSFFFFFFFLPHRSTHLHEREGDGKRNILLGRPLQNLANKSGWCKPTFYTIYTSHLGWNSTMTHCFYHTDLGQKSVFHSFAVQIALIQYSERSWKYPWAFS